MSLRKRLCLRSDSLKRQSFSERICDDLSEVLLQNLPLEDKLRLECVSKQFQRTIFASQRVLIIDFDESSTDWLNKLEYLLKRFPNINEIKMFEYFYNHWKTDIYYNYYIYNQAIQVIIKNSNNLKHFDCIFDELTEESRKKFIEKFALNLISAKFDCNDCPLIEEFFASTRISNLERLKTYSLACHLSAIHFNNLSSLEVVNLCQCELDEFDKFAQSNGKVIRHLILGCYDLETEDQFKRLLTIVSKYFANLIQLSLRYSKYGLNEKSFAKHLTQIAVNCKQIKGLDICYQRNATNAELLSPLRQFKRLKRLRLYFLYNIYHYKDIGLFSFEAFKGFQQLTHLSFESVFDDYETLEETILTDIDINLPKLQSLKIDYLLTASEWTADILSRLSRLESIKIHIIDEEIRYHTKNKLIENCKPIKTIAFNLFES